MRQASLGAAPVIALMQIKLVVLQPADQDPGYPLPCADLAEHVAIAAASCARTLDQDQPTAASDDLE